MSSGAGTGTTFSTGRGRNYPAIRQFTVFLEKSRGTTLGGDSSLRGHQGPHRGTLDFRRGRVCFRAVLLSHPEEGREVLERAGLAIIESDLIGVDLPEGSDALLRICTALLQAEVNIIQAYPLLVRPRGRAAVALMVDNIEMGLETLAGKGFNMITEADLQEPLDE